MEDPLESVSKATSTHCRFCGERKDYGEVLDLAGDLKTLNEYLKIIEYLKIDYLDLSQKNELPKNTCEACYDKFQEAYNFFQKLNGNVTYLKNSGIIDVKNEPEAARKESSTQTNLEEAEEAVNNENLNQGGKLDTEQNINLETVIDCSVINSDPIKLCLFCAEQNISSNLLNLLEEPFLEEYTIIIDFFKIDHLKNTIKLHTCELCFRALQNSYNFFKTVQHSQALLENIYTVKMENILTVKTELAQNFSAKTESANKETNPLALCSITIQDDKSWTNYTYICCHCRVTFDNMEELRAHSKDKHKVCYALRCADCDEQFSGYSEFVEHVRQHREVLRLYCQYCNMRFDAVTQCLQHVDSHYIGTQKMCEMCGEMLPYPSTLEWHRKLYGSASIERTKHKKSWEDYDWICQECGLQAPDVASLRTHTQSAHGKCFAMRCADCSKVMRGYKLLVAHAAQHRPYLKNFCQYCNLQCLDANDLNQHIIQHITSQQRPCTGCGQIFKDNLHLAKHKNTFNRSKPKDPAKARSAAAKRKINSNTTQRRNTRNTLDANDLTCPTCFKLFETLAKLRRHIKTHDGKRRRNFICKTCGRSFLTGHTMNEHSKTHNTKTEVCQVCKKEFHTTSALKHHIITHSEERPFVCDECGNSFKSKRRLKCHLISHSEVKPFKCMYCYKEFNFKMNLKTHEYQHTGLRPYSCEMCEKTFTNWTNCNKHMIRKHGVTLAKTKITSQGRVAINRRTGEAKSLVSNEKTKEWMNEMMKPGKPGKKT